MFHFMWVICYHKMGRMILHQDLIHLLWGYIIEQDTELVHFIHLMLFFDALFLAWVFM